MSGKKWKFNKEALELVKKGEADQIRCIETGEVVTKAQLESEGYFSEKVEKKEEKKEKTVKKGW